MNTDGLRSSFVGSPGSWGGAIRRGKTVVWTCPHRHPNRDYSTTYNTAARECSGYVLEAVVDPERASRQLQAIQSWSPHVSRSDVIEKTKWDIAMREWAIAEAAAIGTSLEAAPR